METIGIGITTRNRHQIFPKTLSQIKKFQPQNSRICIVNDSDDEHRLGIARAKNRCLKELQDCEHIFLFDDDIYPIKHGWAEFYIDASNKSGYKAFSLTMVKSNYHEVQKQVDVSLHDLTFHGYDPIKIVDTRPLAILAHKQALGLHVDHRYTIEKTDNIVLNYHKNPNGFMLYINRKCLKEVGGFNTKFGLYGGEHTEYFTRIKNAGLIPHVGVDVDGSEQFFYAYDADPNVKIESSLTPQEKDHKGRNDRLLDAMRFSRAFIPYD